MKNSIKLIGIRVLENIRVFTIYVVGALTIFLIGKVIHNYVKFSALPSVTMVIVTIGCGLLLALFVSLEDSIKDYLCFYQDISKKNLEYKKQKLDNQYFLEKRKEEIKMEEELKFSQNMKNFAKKFELEVIDEKEGLNLEKMIGLASVKEELSKIGALIKYENIYGGSKEIKVPHMRFIGNPGTGKTTVAKRMAAILYRLGVINKPTCVSLNANDLQGYYMGETPAVVNSLFSKGKGGLIFIDEAYALVSAISSSGHGYGAEAINQLLTQLENAYNENTVVILGGYKEQMDLLFNQNPGLRSRVPLTLNFPDYSPEELVEIFKLNMKERGHTTINAEALEIIRNLIIQKINDCNKNKQAFSNARFIRNISDEIHAEHALNYVTNAKIGTQISSHDIKMNKLLLID